MVVLYKAVTNLRGISLLLGENLFISKKVKFSGTKLVLKKILIKKKL